LAARGIYLIGFSGTGKSTIAEAVGAALNWPVFDLDRVIVERSGMPIPVIFQREGETGFRLRESEALRSVSGSPPFVVATGGGAAIRVENRRFMAGKGWIITLEGRPEALHARIQKQLQQSRPDALRPMLDAAYPLDQIRALKHSRQSVYALADWTVHTDRLTPEQVTAEVVRAVELLEKTPEPPASFDVPAAPLGGGRERDRVERRGGGAPPRSARGSRLLGRIADVRPILLNGRPIAGGKVPLVCTPLVGRTREAIRAEVAAIVPKRPDVIEWRVDFFEGLGSPDDVLAVAADVREAAGGIPVLFTRRAAHEGGERITVPEPRVLEVYDAVCEGRAVEMVDYELSNPAENMGRVRQVSRAHGVGLVASYHDFDMTPPAEELFGKFAAGQRVGADVAKVAVMPKRLEDVLPLLEATLRAYRELTIPVIGMSMGPLGSLTRMFGWVFGSALGFAVGKTASAPGQVPIEDLNQVIEILRRSLGDTRV
jgi:3-dehydroquinate dehydratase I